MKRVPRTILVAAINFVEHNRLWRFTTAGFFLDKNLQKGNVSISSRQPARENEGSF